MSYWMMAQNLINMINWIMILGKDQYLIIILYYSYLFFSQIIYIKFILFFILWHYLSIAYEIYCIIIILMRGNTNKKTPPKSQNIKLKQKSQVFSDVTHVSQRSYQFHITPTVKHLNLSIFKINPCNISKNHNHKHCMNYHNAKDRKREVYYEESQMCQFIKQDQKCPYGDSCQYLHSFVQEHYSSQKYKKQFCSHFPHSVKDCPYGDFCSYAHSEEQILTPLIHNYIEDEDFYMFYYKTQFCPFNLTEHDKSKCVYAHNLQDYRRKPNSLYYNYGTIACFNWKTKDYIYNYLQGCENGWKCNMCHGWKQQQYHPSHYKTMKCQTPGCKKGSCPNYHSQKEKRIIQSQIITKAFIYVPKNRVVQGVFKKPGKKQGYKLKSQLQTKTVIQSRMLVAEENQFKSKTLMAVKQVKRKSNEKQQEKVKWIKQMKDSEQESSQQEYIDTNEIVASQVQKLNLD